MPNELPAWSLFAIAIIGGLGGLAGLAALITAISNARNSAQKTDLDKYQIQLDGLCRMINELQEENARLRQRINELEQANRWLGRENAILRNSLKRAGIEVPEFTPGDPSG